MDLDRENELGQTGREYIWFQGLIQTVLWHIRKFHLDMKSWTWPFPT